MTGRDNSLWLQFWRDKRNDFHQETVNQLLTRFWLSFDPHPGGRVFVPLCGKSLDMLWLASQGYEVIGVELSTVAVKAFFAENHLQPTKRKIGKFTLWRHGKIGILCGDYFSLTKSDLGQIDIVYDRAALTALPEAIRAQYVSHLQRILPEKIKIFLLTAEDAEESPDDSIMIDAEIVTLFSTEFHIELTHVEKVWEDSGLTSQPPEQIQYKLYRVTNRYMPTAVDLM